MNPLGEALADVLGKMDAGPAELLRQVEDVERALGETDRLGTGGEPGGIGLSK